MVVVVTALFSAQKYVKLQMTTGRQETTPLTTKPLRFLLSDRPFSFDPLDFDAFVHHVTGGAVIPTLVNSYRHEPVTGELANEWVADVTMSRWRFWLRRDFSFETGEAVRPEHVVASLKRIAFLQKQQGSKSGLFEHLKGIEDLKSASHDVAGLRLNQGILEMEFTQPMPKLLETLSFGIYGIVHPNDFDPDTGVWKTKTKVTAAGPYQLTTWSDSVMTVTLRKSGYPADLRSPEAAPVIEFKWGDVPDHEADIIMAESSRTELEARGFSFFGPGGKDVSILYIRAISASDPESPLHSHELRRALRDRFYREMEKRGHPMTRSFLPPSMPGIEPPVAIDGPLEPCPFSRNAVIKLIPPRRKAALFRDQAPALIAAAEACGLQIQLVNNVPFAELQRQMDPKTKQFSVDASPIVTGLRVEDPAADVRFMVQSAEGIRLPDPTGRLQSLCEETPIRYDEFNQTLWNDALIWPVAHFVAGLWHQRGVSFEDINASRPPTAVALIRFGH